MEIEVVVQEEDTLENVQSISVPDNVRFFSGIGKVQYSEGWLYYGGLNKGIREGYGKMIWPTGEIYEGQFMNGKANGKGTFTTSQGIVYSGFYF